jgi:endonuclease YncB( thermonuclease family)
VVEEPETPEPTKYLLAFKDHTIYSAVAYWVDGDTLHYFTAGNTHNQASISLIDHDLTQRLNKESGIDFRLPK